MKIKRTSKTKQEEGKQNQKRREGKQNRKEKGKQN